MQPHDKAAFLTILVTSLAVPLISLLEMTQTSVLVSLDSTYFSLGLKVKLLTLSLHVHHLHTYNNIIQVIRHSGRWGSGDSGWEGGGGGKGSYEPPPVCW